MISKGYIPGVCNIGPAEIKRRKRIGWIGLLMTTLLLVMLLMLGVSPLWRLILFIPAAMGATGFIQAYSEFGVGFGMKGLFNFGEEIGIAETVEQQEFRKKDKRKAELILFYSIIIGVIITGLAYLIK